MFYDSGNYWPEVIKDFSCSTQLSQYESIKISRYSVFLCSDQPRKILFLLINVKMQLLAF